MSGGWKPISTAPKDGTEILGYWARSKVYGLTEWRGDGWIDEEGDPVSDPTHWMPLPEPPTP